MPDTSAPPVLVTLTRGGIVEVQHRGYACVTDNNGNILYAVGNPEFVTFLRSSAKPFQAASVIVSGAADAFRLTPVELAIMSGSHGGEPLHTQLVEHILGRGEFSVGDLQCGTHPPLEADARRALEKAGEAPNPLHHNCSGKHAGMLLTAKHTGEDPAGYLDPQTPLQQRVLSVVAESTGDDPNAIVVGVDGCSVPVHGISMRGIATSFARLVKPDGVGKALNNALTRIGESMRAYPEMVAATKGRTCTDLIRAGVSCLITGKAGAEGVYGAGWRDPATGKAFGLSVKMEDGGQRGRDPVLIALLQKYGALPSLLPESLFPYAAGPIKNWREIVVGQMEVHLT